MKLGQKTKHANRKSKPKLVSGPIVRLIHQSIAKRHQFENCDYCKVSYGKFAIQILIKITISKWWHFTVLWSVTLKISALTKLGLFFPVVCFISHVFAEQLYRDKGLWLFSLSLVNNKIQGISLAEKSTVWRLIDYGGWLVWDSQNIYECSRRIITCFSFYLSSWISNIWTLTLSNLSPSTHSSCNLSKFLSFEDNLKKNKTFTFMFFSLYLIFFSTKAPQYN